MTTKSKTQRSGLATTKTKTAKASGPSKSEQIVEEMRDLETRITAARAELQSLEDGRTAAALTGDPVAHSGRILQQREVIKTLEAARAELNKQREEATERERREALESQAEKIRTEMLPGIEAEYRRLHEALRAVIGAAGRIAAHEQAIRSANKAFADAKRPDLIVQDNARQLVSDEITGSKDSEFVPPQRMPGESDDAYTLRVGNARSIARDKRLENDVFRRLGHEAIEKISMSALGMSAHQRARRRIIDAVSYLDKATGEVVEKQVDVVPNYRDLKVGPYGRDRAEFNGNPERVARGVAAANA